MLLAIVVLLYAFLFFIFFSSYAFDDLGFDFPGYALRYHFAFSGWIKNLLFGVPAGTFDGVLPAFLPLFLKALGIGSFTLPVTASVFLLQLAIPIIFIAIGRLFGLDWKKAILLGLVFVLNPFSFKFFNRYFEFASWFFFLAAFLFYYKFLEAKRFEKKYFAPGVLASTAIVLSHPSGIYFWAIAFACILKDFVDLKRFAAIAFFTGALSAFWLLPFFSFAGFSIVAGQKGAELMTTGIKAASYFFALAMPIIWIVFSQKLKENKRVFRLFSFSTALAIVYAIAPQLPVLNVPFAHSFHAFFAFASLLAIMQLLKARAVTKNHFIAAAIVLAACVVVLFPVVARQYFFSEPRYSSFESDFGGQAQRINFTDIKALLEKIPKDSRFETLPYDALVSPYSAMFYDLVSLRGWGYNAYSLKESDALAKKLTSMNISCEEFVAGSELTATPYWIAMNETGEKFLKNCGLKKLAGKLPALYFLESNKATLVDGAELLELENTRIRFKATQKTVLVKANFFPRWHAFSGGKEIPIEDAHPGMLIETQPDSVVELQYGFAQIDLIGIIVSIAAILLFVLALV